MYSKPTDIQPVAGHQASRRGLAGAAAFTVAHGMLWCCLLAVLLLVVPRFINFFEECDLRLPPVSLLTVLLSQLVVQYWYLFVVLGVPALALEFMVLFALGRSRRILQVVAGVLLTLVPLLLGAVVFLGIWLPTTGAVDALR